MLVIAVTLGLRWHPTRLPVRNAALPTVRPRRSRTVTLFEPCGDAEAAAKAAWLAKQTQHRKRSLAATTATAVDGADRQALQAAETRAAEAEAAKAHAEVRAAAAEAHEVELLAQLEEARAETQWTEDSWANEWAEKRAVIAERDAALAKLDEAVAERDAARASSEAKARRVAAELVGAERQAQQANRAACDAEARASAAELLMKGRATAAAVAATNRPAESGGVGLRAHHATSDIASSSDEIMHLSVGGTRFATLRATLCAARGSALDRHFAAQPAAPPLRDEAGAYFLDRNPQLFGYLLDYLRSGCRLHVAPPAPLLPAVRAEAAHWELHGLVDELDELDEVLAPPPPPALPPPPPPAAEAVQFFGSEQVAAMRLDRRRRFHPVTLQVCRSVFVRTDESTCGAPTYVARGSERGAHQLVLHRHEDERGRGGWFVSPREFVGTGVGLLTVEADAGAPDQISSAAMWRAGTHSRDGDAPADFENVPALYLRAVPASG